MVYPSTSENQFKLAWLDGETSHLIAGYLYQQANDLQGGIRELERSIAIQPNSSTAHLYLAECYEQLNDTDRVIALLSRAITLNPRNDQAHAKLGSAFAKKRNLGAALESYATALSLRPDEPVYRRNYSYLLELKKKGY